MGINSEVTLLPVATLVLWLTCLAIGIAGVYLHYPWPRPPPKEPPPISAQRINVQIAPQNLAQPQTGAPSAITPQALPQPAPPQTPAPPLPTAAPPMAAVAKLLPAPAFALPVEGPHRVTDAKAPVPIAVTPIAPPTNAPQQLVYGQGEGKQPAPEYPREAVIDREEGTVIVQFNVDENGRVTDARASTPSPWPALNHAAVRAVRDTWRFPAGSPRKYEVSIEFQLVQK